MTERLDHAIATVRRLPPERQDELAEFLEAAGAEPAGCTPDQIAAVDEGLADADAGRFCPSSEVEAIFHRFRSA